MRLLVWAIVAGLVLGAGIGWWSLQRDRTGGAPGAAVPAPSAPAAGAAETAPTLYRWRDDAGTLHITDQPPEGRPYEVVRIRDDQNVVPMGGPAPEPEPEPEPEAAPAG